MKNVIRAFLVRHNLVHADNGALDIIGAEPPSGIEREEQIVGCVRIMVSSFYLIYDKNTQKMCIPSYQNLVPFKK